MPVGSACHSRCRWGEHYLALADTNGQACLSPIRALMKLDAIGEDAVRLTYVPA
jgi:hypothetical protein